MVTVVIVAILYLAVTGQLVLYIHPRYVAFTVAMALIGLVFVVAGLANRQALAGHDHLDEQPGRGWRLLASVTGGVVTVAMALALVIIPPTTLTTATVAQREINSTGLGSTAGDVDLSGASDETISNFTVRDWATLLRQSSDMAFYEANPANVVGFITADEEDSENAFYVSRFVVTCCAVDAQPVGVLVHWENWQAEFERDQWVEVNGTFEANPSRSSSQPMALIPSEIVPVEQPGEPYLY